MKNKSLVLIPTKILSLAALGIAAAALSGCAASQATPTKVAAGASCQELASGSEALDQFYQPGAVKSVSAVKERIFVARAHQPVRTMGASLYMPAQPDMNGPYLQRVLACHAAQGQSVHPNDPLHPQSGAITELVVREKGNGYSVDVLSDDPRVGREILQRAESFARPSSDVRIEEVASTPAPFRGM